MFLGGICFITGGRSTRQGVEDSVKRVLDAGVRFIQYREKELSRREIYVQAERIKRITDTYKAVFIVNDHCDIALAVDAAGVHLGRDDMPLKDAKRIMRGKVIGISTHDPAQAAEAAKGGANYIGFGPIFQTATKDAGEPKGAGMIADIKKHVSIPLVAIGGIHLKNLKEVFEAGADAAAISSGILNAADVYGMAKRVLETISRY